MLAGLGGFLYAAQYGFVTPEILSWHQSGNALVMIILGGAVVGAFAFVLLSEWFSALSKHWQLLFGYYCIGDAARLLDETRHEREEIGLRVFPTPQAKALPRRASAVAALHGPDGLRT